MLKKRLQNRVAESRMALPIAGIYALVVCLMGGVWSQQMWLQLGLLALSSFLMMELNNANSLIRIYSRMVSCSFLFLAVMSYFLFPDIKCGVVEICFISFYIFLFNAYQDKRAIGSIFYAFLMIGVASTVFVQILYFLPIIWILMGTNIMVLNFRTALASLLGLIVPYWFMSSYYIYIGHLDVLATHFAGLVLFDDISGWYDVPLHQVLTAIFVAILSFLGIIHFRLNNYKDKIRIRMLFEIFSFMAIFTMVFLTLQPQLLHCLLALLIVSTSPMVGHYIALTNSKVTNISFVLILLINIALTAYNIWIQF